MSNNSRSCGKCAFFEGSDGSPGEGECRRYAPQPTGERRETMWVTVAANDWCGDFEAAS